MTAKLNKFTQYVADNWNGEQPLWVPFFVHGFGMGTLLGAFFTTVLLERLTLLARVQSSVTLDNFAGPALLVYSTVALLGFWLTYHIWNLMSTIRCAKNADNTICKIGAPVFSVVVFATYWALVAKFAWGILA